MNESTLTELANLFLALSDKTRLRLLALMAEGEVSVGFLAESLNESQPKTSRHLAYLRSAGLVSTRRDGKWIYYDIAKPSDEAVKRVLTATIESLAGIKDHRFVSLLAPAKIEKEIITDPVEDIYARTYVNDAESNELEIFLL